MRRKKQPTRAPIPINEAVADYWLKHYLDNDGGVCSLCGNVGIIDTRATAVSPVNVLVGRLNWCICPNGQTRRSMNNVHPPSGWSYDAHQKARRKI